MRHLKRIFSVLFLLAAFSVFAKPQADSNKIQNHSAFTITDSADRIVEIPSNVRKVAPAGSVAQMIIYTLDPDCLAGWSGNISMAAERYIDKKYLSLPVFGQFYGKNVNLNMEALMAASPDLIIDMGDKKAGHKEAMDKIQETTGIPVVFIEADIDSFPAAYRTLGKILQKEKEAEAIASYIEEVLKEAEANQAKIKGAAVKRVYFGGGPKGLDANAKGSVHTAVIDIIGAENALVVDNVSNKGGGNQINIEQLMIINPDLIILENKGPYANLKTDPLWSTLRAVKNNTYYEIPNDPYNWMGTPPSVNRIIGIRWLGNLVYPELYKTDIVKEARYFYKLFWHYDLSENEAKELLSKSSLK